jgi:hypothetical protein
LLNNAYILEYLLIAIKVSFWLVLLGWLIEETIFIVKEKASIQWGKILWIITSSLNWFIGIVWINSDLVFSISNVVAHGLPYLVLVFYYKFKEFKIENIQLEMPSLFMKLFNMFLFILVLAIVEEYLWDLFVNREKQAFFEYIFDYSIAYIDDNNFQAVAIGVLSLPQVVHYVLDGFLWKMNKNNTRFKEIMKNE